MITPAPEDLGRVAPPPKPAAVLDHKCEEPQASTTATFTNAQVEVAHYNIQASTLMTFISLQIILVHALFKFPYFSFLINIGDYPL